jgi:hypothetical protein
MVLLGACSLALCLNLAGLRQPRMLRLLICMNFCTPITTMHVVYVLGTRAQETGLVRHIRSTGARLPIETISQANRRQLVSNDCLRSCCSSAPPAHSL